MTVLNGTSEDDFISGGAGNDQINGGEGDDIINGGFGNDVLRGGSGSNLFIFEAGFGTDKILDFQLGVDHLYFAGIDINSIVVSNNNGSTKLSVGSNTVILTGVHGPLQLSDLLDKPPEINNQSFSLAENTPAGAVGTIAASDPEGGPLTYAILGGSPHFTINTHTGLLSASTSFDFETQSTYSLTIQATDHIGQTSQAAITVNITDVSEAPSLFTENSDTINFNTVLAADYQNGTQYNALGGNDVVVLPDAENAGAAGYVLGTPFYGGNGDDTINGGTANDIIYGGTGNDILNGGGGNNTVHGEDGNDTLQGGTGNDIISGDAGIDNFVMNGHGMDAITDFTPGVDRLDVNSNVQNINTSLDGNPVLTLENGDLTLLGLPLMNSTYNMFVNGHTAQIIGLNDSDNNLVFTASSSDKIVWAGAGNDEVNMNNSTTGNFLANLGLGDDTAQLDTTGKDIIIYGGDGKDFFSMQGRGDFATGNIQLHGGNDNDLINLNDVSGLAPVYLHGDAGDDMISSSDFGFAFHNSIIGNKFLYGGDGNDQLSVIDATSNASVDSSRASTLDGGNGNDTLVDGASTTDLLLGGAGDDIIRTDFESGSFNTLQGGEGNDTLITTLEGFLFSSIDQIFKYDAVWNGTNLVSNDGSDLIKVINSLHNTQDPVSFLSTDSKIVIDVSNQSGTSVTEAEIFAHISSTSGTDSSISFGDTSVELAATTIGATPLDSFVDMLWLC